MGLYDAVKKINEQNAKISKRMDTLWDRMESARKTIERCENQMQKIKRPHWTDALLSIKDDMERVSGMTYKASRDTFGLGCRTYIDLVGEDGNKMFLCIVPKHSMSDEMVLEYETGETTDHFQPGSIGAINGMNNITAPLPDTAEEIFAVMKKVNGK